MANSKNHRVQAVCKHTNPKKVWLRTKTGKLVVAKIVAKNGDDMVLRRPGHQQTFRRNAKDHIVIAA